MVGAVGLMQMERRLERKWLAGRIDGSKPKRFTGLRSFVNGKGAELDVNISAFDHEHFCGGKDGCIASIIMLTYRQERHMQIGVAMAFGSKWWEGKRKGSF